MNTKLLIYLLIPLFLILLSCDESVIVLVIDDTPLDGRGGGVFAIVSDASGEACIYVINADGSGMRKVTTEEGIESQPEWSPDGMRLSFAADYDGDNNIYVVDVLDMETGTFSEPLQLTDDGGFMHSWSPDGNQIAFENSWDETESRLFIMNSDGTNKNEIQNTNTFRQPVWSPDGTKIACVVSPAISANIMIMNIDGSNQVILTTTITDEVKAPAWSPDGTMIAFDRYTATTMGIGLINVDGTNARWLSQNGMEYPSFSPDSLHIVCDSGMTGNREQVYILKVDGSEELRVTNSSTYYSNEPAWRPTVAN